MKSPLIHENQIVSFRIVGWMLAIAPMWLMLAATNTSAYAQTSDEVSNITATTSSPADWTQFLRDNMQRWNPYETAIGINNAKNLQLKWKNPIGVSNSFVPSSPAVANGVVYYGSENGKLYAINADTGSGLWSFTPSEISSFGNQIESPAVANEVVYVGSANSYVYALNARTGAKLWSFNTESMFGFGGPIEGAATVANGIVYIGNVQAIFALNAETGAVLWSRKEPEVVGAPAIANGVVYVTSSGSLEALNATTGAQLWIFRVSANVYTAPAVANGVVYFGSFDDGKIYALNASTGALLWSYTADSFVESSPAVANGAVYFGSDDNNVYALNAQTGAKLWSYNTAYPVRSSPAIANGVVYINSGEKNGNTSFTDGNLYALNASSGAKLWSYHTGPAGLSSTAVVDGVVYIRAGDSAGGNLYAFSLGADLFLRINPSTTTVHQGDLLTFAFPVWNLGPGVAEGEVLTNLQVPAGTTFDYVRISGTPGLGKCTHPPYGGTGQIICHEGDGMAPNTTWTVRLTVKVTAPAGTVITESAATMADTPDPNLANNMATVSLTVVP
jgi:outer membrane protein assembly factor BamB